MEHPDRDIREDYDQEADPESADLGEAEGDELIPEE